VTDTLSRRSTTQFDPILHTYPTTFTNALTQTSTLRYDFGLGKPLTATNPNGVSSYVQYDTLGRVIKVIEDGDSAAYPTTQYTYSDNYQANGLRGLKVETIQREVAGSAAAADVVKLYQFYSGRGILVQARADMGSQTSPQQAVTTPGYDAAGRVITGYVPYQATTYSAD
jgi:YD repeat-containing protein